MTLVEFLLARIAEDEAVAREATTGLITAEWWGKQEHGRVYAGHWVPVVETASYIERAEDPEDNVEHPGVGSSTLPHIGRHDPARVLAECEAKRRIIGLHKIEGRPESVWHDREDGLHQLVKATEYTCSVCGWVGEDGPDGIGTTGCDTLRALALPYADHPDYREEWKP